MATEYSARMCCLSRSTIVAAGLALVALTAGCGTPRTATPIAAGSARYEDLTTLFGEWRSFQQPKRVDGAPDYSAAAMAAQERELSGFANRLVAIDPTSWPIPQQVDYYVVRAEMHGLEFDHRVLKPWANNPAFYVTAFGDESDQPAREGPLAAGGVELWKYTFPLSKGDADAIGAGLQPIPKLLDQAKTNLTGNQKDLWTYGEKAIRAQSAELAALAAKLSETQPDLRATVERARTATDALATWLDSQAPSKTGPSGIGVPNYNWYLKNVQLVPYTWQDEVTLMERELERSSASLALEEQKHAKLIPPVPIASAAEHDQRFAAAVTEYMAFLEDRRDPDNPARHGPRAARASRHLLARPARVLRRSRRPRPGSDAHPRLSLVRQGLDGECRPPESGAQGSAALQHLQHTHRGLRDGVRRADASGWHVRGAAALARAGLHPGRRTRCAGEPGRRQQ